MVLFKRLLPSFVAVLPAASASPLTPGCGTDNCLQAVSMFPWISGDVSTFCESYINSKPCTDRKHTKTVTQTVKATSSPHTVDVFSTKTVDVTGATQTVDESTTITSVIFVMPGESTALATTTSESTVLVPTVCSTTVTLTSLSTTLFYVSSMPTTAPSKKRSAPEVGLLQAHQSLANLCNHGCGAKHAPLSARMSSACSCYLDKATEGTTTKTVTVTSAAAGATVSSTIVSTDIVSEAGPTVTDVSTSFIYTTPIQYIGTVTDTATVVQTTTVETCQQPESTPTVFAATSFTCGNTFATVPTASTSGTITCADTVPTPSMIGLLRIEGLQEDEGTIFEGCILSGPRNITTPSGGTHECDGTNNNANLYPGTTPTDQLDAAAEQNGFSFDGTYNQDEQDFTITQISNTYSDPSESWAFFNDYQNFYFYGCQEDVPPGSSTAWIFAGNDYRYLLEVYPSYAVVEAGSGTVTVGILDGATDAPMFDASFAGQTSDIFGQVTFPVPDSAGCYQYKATKLGAAPSNAFYLTVLPAGTFSS